MLTTMVFCAASFLSDCELHPTEPIRIGLRVAPVEAPAEAETVEVELFATHVFEKFTVKWIAGIAYDSSVLELVDLVEPPEVGDHPFNYFTAYPELGRALLDGSAEVFNEREFTPDQNHEAQLCTLVFKVLQPRSAVVEPTSTFLWHNGREYPSRTWYCYDHVPFDPDLLVPGEITFIEGGKIFIRGDMDADGRLTLTDALRILHALFAGQMDQVKCQDAVDADDDGRMNMTDAIVILSFLFQSAPPPRPPSPDPGIDPTPDDLTCG